MYTESHSSRERTNCVMAKARREATEARAQEREQRWLSVRMEEMMMETLQLSTRKALVMMLNTPLWMT